MLVLLDQGAPAPLRKHLVNHDVVTVAERGWSTIQNGELLQRAEVAGFEFFVTTDQHLKYQQNLDARQIAIVVLSSTSWPRIRRSVDKVVSAVAAATSGSLTEVQIP